MTHRNPKILPAMTAIAAVIALSTPSFAQSAGEPIAVTSAPAIELAPAPTPVTVAPLAPAPVMGTPAADPLAAAAADKPAARPPPVVARAANASPSRSATGATISDPDDTASIEPPAFQQEAAPVQAAGAELPATADTNMNDSMIPIAGIGALGILALVGTGLVMRRRRRRAEDADEVARRELAGTDSDADLTEIDEPEPAMIVEPDHMPQAATPATAAETAAVAAAVIAAHEPSPEIDGPVTELPEEFDTSQFGLHAQAAYNGPTEDNPSLSLKHRLRRAMALDQQARRREEEAPKTFQAGAKSELRSGDFMFRRPEMEREREVERSH